jgi:hypothetical protein
MKIEYYACKPNLITPDMAYDKMDYLNELKAAEVEVITTIDFPQEIKDAIYDSYLNLPVSVIVSFKGKLYRSDGTIGSYGSDDWSEWYEVTAKQRTIVVYEK